MHNPCRLAPLLARSDGSQNCANCLGFPRNEQGWRKRKHQGLLRIATDVTPPLSQIATEAYPPGDRISEEEGIDWCWLGNIRGLSSGKGESDPKRRALVNGTLYSDGPAMFLDDAFHDREA